MTDSWDKNIIRLIIISIYFAIIPMAEAQTTIEGIQVYQKNVHLSPEHKQEIADDIDRYYNADNMWEVIRSEFSLPHYDDNPQVQQQITWFLNNQDYLMRTAERAAPYLFFIAEQARKRHLPAEVVLLPMIESAYNPFNYSSAGAAGIWQLMPGTASGYGVKQNWWYDGRRDVVQSTNAALDYLVYLGNFFDGNWLLAIAAYDTGEGNIVSAIRKNNRNGINTDFWSLPVAQETRIYVPRLLALAIVISHADEYGIKFPPVNNAPYLAQIDIGGQIDLNHAATLAGLTLKQLKKLNPGYNRTATDPNGPFKIILPIENVAQFTENLMDSPQPVEKKIKIALEKIQKKYSIQPGDTFYMVRKNDTLQKIAARFHLSVTALLSANPTKKSKGIVPGQHMIIPTNLTKQQTRSPKKYAMLSGDTVYMVRTGDTLEKIANKFHTSPPAIRVANLMASNTIREGDEIIVPTHN